MVVLAEADVGQDLIHVSPKAGQLRDENDVYPVLHSIGQTLIQDKTVLVFPGPAYMFFKSLHYFNAVFVGMGGQIKNLTLR